MRQERFGGLSVRMTGRTDETTMLMAAPFISWCRVEDGDDGAGEIRGVSRYAQREHNNARTVDQPEERLCPGGPSEENNL